MPPFIIFAIFICAFILWRYWRGLTSDEAKQSFKKQSMIWGLVALIGVLALMGRIHWLGAVIAAILPLIKIVTVMALRHLPALAAIYGANPRKRPLKMQSENISVEYILSEHRMTGEVLNGEFTGKTLNELSEEDQLSLQQWLEQQKDSKGLKLLSLFITLNKVSQNQQQYQSPPPETNALMSEQEARDILGLDRNATAAQIKYAHKQLMQKLHPDKGGNAYLAAKINQARDHLLKK